MLIQKYKKENKEENVKKYEFQQIYNTFLYFNLSLSVKSSFFKKKIDWTGIIINIILNHIAWSEESLITMYYKI